MLLLRRYNSWFLMQCVGILFTTFIKLSSSMLPQVDLLCGWRYSQSTHFLTSYRIMQERLRTSDVLLGELQFILGSQCPNLLETSSSFDDAMNQIFIAYICYSFVVGQGFNSLFLPPLFLSAYPRHWYHNTFDLSFGKICLIEVGQERMDACIDKLILESRDLNEDLARSMIGNQTFDSIQLETILQRHSETIRMITQALLFREYIEFRGNALSFAKFKSLSMLDVSDGFDICAWPNVGPALPLNLGAAIWRRLSLIRIATYEFDKMLEARGKAQTEVPSKLFRMISIPSKNEFNSLKRDNLVLFDWTRSATSSFTTSANYGYSSSNRETTLVSFVIFDCSKELCIDISDAWKNVIHQREPGEPSHYTVVNENFGPDEVLIKRGTILRIQFVLDCRDETSRHLVQKMGMLCNFRDHRSTRRSITFVVGLKPIGNIRSDAQGFSQIASDVCPLDKPPFIGYSPFHFMQDVESWISRPVKVSQKGRKKSKRKPRSFRRRVPKRTHHRKREKRAPALL